MAIHKLFPAALEFLSNLFAMLPERRRRRINAWPAMREGEGRERDAETAFNSGRSGVAVNDAAGRELRIR